MTLGEKIQELRRKNAMSQDVLAEKLEVSRQAVSKWERDEAVPETDKIVRIAQLFCVSTDYLLLNEQPEPQQEPQPQPERPRQSFRLWERFERIVRRHGYKMGYIPIAIGGILCVVALLVMTLLPNFGSGFFDVFGGFGSGWSGEIYFDEDIPADVVDDLYGEMGGGLVGGFHQSVNQMQNAWQNSLRSMAAMWGVPLLLIGGASIALGIFIIIKGKKLLQQ